MSLMIEVHQKFETLPGCQDIMDLVYHQKETLRKEVEKYSSERMVQ